MARRVTRRSFVKGSILGSAGVALGMSPAPAIVGTAAPAEAPPASAEGAPPASADLPLPRGKIGKLEVSRMLLGGNLLTHFTHSRDLAYVYNLARHYNTKEKILETLAVAEAQGINTLSVHTAEGIVDILREHREKRGGKMQWIICPTEPVEEGLERYERQVKQLLDVGTDAIYLWGVRSEELLRAGRIDLIRQAVELPKRLGVPSGVGGHELSVVQACEKEGVPSDFYLKTLHHHGYPSSKLNHDSLWCAVPDETIAFMRSVEKPWVAFKTMAAGAIPPRDAFRYAVEGGADFVLAGMFDYEIAEDVKILREILAGTGERARPWRA
jgi:hypothetical protein